MRNVLAYGTNVPQNDYSGRRRCVREAGGVRLRAAAIAADLPDKRNRP
jgi:hypothetical protein